MTYNELEKLTEGKKLPFAGKNESGENVIIDRGCDRWSYRGEAWEKNFFKLTTAQSNGWVRINFVYDDGSTDELYQKGC